MNNFINEYRSALLYSSVCCIVLGFISLFYDGHPGGLLILSLPGFLVGLVVYLKSPKKRSSGKGAADELLKWSQLKESGVITEEEFKAKKKDLLG